MIQTKILHYKYIIVMREEYKIGSIQKNKEVVDSTQLHVPDSERQGRGPTYLPLGMFSPAGPKTSIDTI